MPGLCPKCGTSVYHAEEVRAGGLAWHRACLSCAECSRRVDPGSAQLRDTAVYCPPCYRKLYGPKGYGYGGVLSQEESPARPMLGTHSASKQAVAGDEAVVRSGSGSRAGLRSPRRVTAGFGGGSAGGRPEADATRPWASLPGLQSSSANSNTRPVRTSQPALLLPAAPATFTLRSAFRKPRTSSLSCQPALPPGPARRPVRSADSPGWQSPAAPLCARCAGRVYQAELARACGRVWHRACFTCRDCSKLLDSNSLCERAEDIYCTNCYHRNYGPRGVGFGIGANLQT